MKQNGKIPLHFSAEIEERLYEPAGRRWHAQFMFYPLGYFRGSGACPGAALARAWSEFRVEVDPGRRWWATVLGAVPQIRF